MLRGIASKALLLVVTIGGLAVLLIAAWPFLAHIAELNKHFRSGSWETISDRAALQSLIERKFYDRSRWLVSFPAGSAQALLFDAKDRDETLRSIGHGSVSDQAGFVLTGETLPEDYRSLLDSIDHKYDGLASAWTDFNAYALGKGALFPAFDVFSTPAYDNEGALVANTVVLAQQSGKCVGEIRSVDANPSKASGTISTYARVLEIKLQRPWLSESLLDSASRSDNPHISAFFHPNGPLTNIPDRIWVLMPDRITIRGAADSDSQAISTWVQDRVCCQVVCPGLDARLSPSTLHFQADKAVIGNRQGVEPLLYAIISRRRLHL